jgi:hypothetical protein
MNIAHDLLAEIAAFANERGISESTFGRMAVNDGKFVGRLRKSTVTIASVDKARAFIKAERDKAASPQQPVEGGEAHPGSEASGNGPERDASEEQSKAAAAA